MAFSWSASVSASTLRRDLSSWSMWSTMRFKPVESPAGDELENVIADSARGGRDRRSPRVGSNPRLDAEREEHAIEPPS